MTIIDTKQLTKARDFAIRKHWGQTYGNSPYIDHLDKVVEVLAESPYANTVMLISAYLHDSLEDTDTTYEELSAEFGIRIAATVHALTNPGEIDVYYQILQGNHTAIAIKIADRISNICACICGDNANEKKLLKYVKGSERFEVIFRPPTEVAYKDLWYNYLLALETAAKRLEQWEEERELSDAP